YVAAGSTTWGVGHLRRSLAVIAELKGASIPLRTVAWVPSDEDRSRLTTILAGYDQEVLRLDQISLLEADALVVDVGTACQPLIGPWLEASGIPVVALDWYSPTAVNFCAVINLRGGASALRQAIIRKEFLQARVQPGPSTYDAVVVMGGADPRGHLARLLSIFRQAEVLRGRRILFFAGPLSSLAGDNVPGAPWIEIVRQSGDIAGLMAASRLGLTNGGTALMELTSLGKPTIVFPQTEEEDAFVGTFLDLGCSESGTLEAGALIGAMMRLWENNDVWQERSAIAMALIDGQGASRVAARILSAFGIVSGKQAAV
ncbi:MAG: hypothetical protein HQL22_11130, partial [Candidatus Omnitrophica bacterium]|nr:hypothetical protein [Candidatus Omnitrophota bacterium]